MSKTKLILTDNVVGLGSESDMVEVASGYARNFLLPQGQPACPPAIHACNVVKAPQTNSQGGGKKGHTKRLEFQNSQISVLSLAIFLSA